jgi:hypothetical protein
MVECLLRGLVADDACYLAYLTQRRVGVRLVPGTTVVVGCLVFCSGPPGCLTHITLIFRELFEYQLVICQYHYSNKKFDRFSMPAAKILCCHYD